MRAQRRRRLVLVEAVAAAAAAGGGGRRRGGVARHHPLRHHGVHVATHELELLALVQHHRLAPGDELHAARADRRRPDHPRPPGAAHLEEQRVRALQAEPALLAGDVHVGDPDVGPLHVGGVAAERDGAAGADGDRRDGGARCGLEEHGGDECARVRPVALLTARRIHTASSPRRLLVAVAFTAAPRVANRSERASTIRSPRLDVAPSSRRRASRRTRSAATAAAVAAYAVAVENRREATTTTCARRLRRPASAARCCACGRPPPPTSGAIF